MKGTGYATYSCRFEDSPVRFSRDGEVVNNRSEREKMVGWGQSI